MGRTYKRMSNLGEGLRRSLIHEGHDIVQNGDQVEEAMRDVSTNPPAEASQ